VSRFGLLGRTLGHSWSVPIHTALGCGNYQLFETEPDALPSFLAQPDLAGLNVTIPYKQTVVPHCAALDETACAVGAVNTMVRRSGQWFGLNTDVSGLRYMAARAGVAFPGTKVVIFGSGGASLTAQYVARTAGARELAVISRSGPDNYQTLDRHADADILINATPVGMYPNVGVSPVDLRAFPRCRGVLDCIYNPLRTALLLQAETLNIPCSDGLPMLVAQAKAAEEAFFGNPIPDSETERILAALRRQQTNLILIGMPGCGKSSVGAALARLTGRKAVDLDDWIEDRAGCTIPEIFSRQGEAAFRALEREAAAEAGAQTGCILMTGGGIVKDPRNDAPLRQNGRVYHLVRPLDALATEGRPLSEGADLSAMWAEREPLYARVRDSVIENCGTISETAAAIWRDFCEHFGAERP
jgi:shikimate dehydrogenase